MNNNKKKNRIILCICSIMVLVASIFAFIPINKESKIVYADTVTSDYSFSGSNIYSKTTFTNGLFSYNLLNLNDTNSITSHGVTISVYNNIVTLNGSTSSFTTFFISHNLIDAIVGSYNFSFHYVAGDITGYSGAYTLYNQVGGNELRYPNTSLVDNVPDNLSFNTLRVAISSGITFNNFKYSLQYVQGSINLPYQQYQDSSFVNYKFDFTSLSTIRPDIVNATTVGVSAYDSYGYEYKLTYAISSVPTEFNVYSQNSLFDPLNGSFPNPVGPLYFSRYDSITGTVNDDYQFNLYTTISTVGTVLNPLFTSDVSYIALGSYNDFTAYFNQEVEYSTSYYDLYNSKYNFISYVSSNNTSFNIIIPLESSFSTDYWDFRTYYVESLSDTDAQIIYNSGYRDGYSIGESIGQQNGYSSGYNTGKNDGYNLGYNTALDSDQYSFTSLISAVIDVPVKAFTSLFNFDILGVNLSGFFLGLLTCCIVIGVIRLIL